MDQRIALLSSLSTLLVTGCAQRARLDLTATSGGNAALIGQFQAYDGHGGRAISFAEIARRAAHADVILFGEEHSDAVCNQIEAQLLYALVEQRRPVALALEFFEADTQAALDAYMLGRLDEAAFREQTRQNRAYVLSHRPLIELCRLAHVPVIAANAPRRLVTGFRKSGLSYQEYRAGLDPSDRRWLPTTNEHVGGSYEVRFGDLMAQHEGPTPTTQSTTRPSPTTDPAEMPDATADADTATATSRPAPDPGAPTQSAARTFYWAQLLWDQALAESLANFRERYPSHRIMLLVGSFHVAYTGGTVTKFLRRRPHDRLLTIVYRSTLDGHFPFQDEDRHAGDIVIYGIAAPPKKDAAGQAPAAPATTQPTAATQPVPTTAPTSQPAEGEPGGAVHWRSSENLLVGAGMRW